VIPRASGPIGYSAAHLDALEFIDRMATSLDLPVVVNVSEPGHERGAHDGKSALEVGFTSPSSATTLRLEVAAELDRTPLPMLPPLAGVSRIVHCQPVLEARPVRSGTA
jgi:hypothetical protein